MLIQQQKRHRSRGKVLQSRFRKAQFVDPLQLRISFKFHIVSNLQAEKQKDPKLRQPSESKVV
jgi:hypothetical protein